MSRRELYQRVCEQYGLQLVIKGPRWKVVDSNGASLTPSTFPPYVRGFLDGYAKAMERVQAG